MTRVLVLDDDKNRLAQFKKKHPDAVLVETAPECIAALKREKFDVIYLDHDLGGEVYVPTGREDTGSGVTRFMVNRSDEHKQQMDVIIICHSLNFDGRANMVSLLKLGGFRDTVDVPFTSMRFD